MKTLQQISGWIIYFTLFLCLVSPQVLAEEYTRNECALTELAIGEKIDTPVAAFEYPFTEGTEPVSGYSFREHYFFSLLLSHNMEYNLQLRTQKKLVLAKFIFPGFHKARFFSSEESEEAFPIA